MQIVVYVERRRQVVLDVAPAITPSSGRLWLQGPRMGRVKLWSPADRK